MIELDLIKLEAKNNLELVVKKILLVLAVTSLMIWSCGCGQAQNQAPNPKLQQAFNFNNQGNYQQAEQILNELVKEQPDNAKVWYQLGYARHSQEAFVTAIEAYRNAAKNEQVRSPALYNIACAEARLGRTDAALATLQSAIDAGFNNADQLENDSDFDSIKNEAAFAEFLQAMRKKERLFVEDTRIIHRINGENAGDEFGWVARVVGDVDKDGVLDFVATAPSAEKGNGKIYVYSGKSAKLLFEATGNNAERLGNGASGAGDVNNDGTPDIICGAPQGPNGGGAYVYSGVDGKILHTLPSPKAGFRFGYKVGSLGDINQDGHDDVIVTALTGDCDRDGTINVYASDFNASTAAKGAGKIVVHSGATGKELYSINGLQAGEGFGTSPSDAGDVNGDGIGDLVVGAWQHASGAPSGGKVTLYDGATATELDAWTCTVQGDTFGFDAVGIGDVDGDNQVDFLLTSAWANVRGPKTGRVFVIAGDKYAKPPSPVR